MSNRKKAPVGHHLSQDARWGNRMKQGKQERNGPMREDMNKTMNRPTRWAEELMKRARVLCVLFAVLAASAPDPNDPLAIPAEPVGCR